MLRGFYKYVLKIWEQRFILVSFLLTMKIKFRWRHRHSAPLWRTTRSSAPTRAAVLLANNPWSSLTARRCSETEV